MTKPKARGSERKPHFERNARFGSDPVYEIVDRSGRGSASIKALGSGLVGVVYRARFKKLERAIKFMSPSHSGSQPFQLPLGVLEDEFDREIALLSRVTHTNIAKIVDYGRAPADDAIYSYYVMEYIDGEPLGAFASSASGRHFADVVGQLLDALVYLHGLGYYHLDIKEENVFVQGVGPRRVRTQTPPQAGLWEQAPHAVLLDLGGAKAIPDYFDGDSRQTMFYSTPKAVRERLRAKVGQLISRGELKTEGPDLDLYAVGAMLDRLVALPGVEERLRAYVKDSGFRALRWIINRLIEDFPHHRYRSAEQLRRDWQRLYPEYVWPMGLQDLSDSAAESSIQLATGQLRLSPQLLEVTNHPVYRRLKRLRQLEFVNELYPDSEHTRYSHSLEAFRLARFFLLQLLRHAEFRMLATPDHALATLLVALLHDIGHYPLLHAFEDFTTEAVGRTRFATMPERSRPLSDESLFESLVRPLPRDPYAAAITAYLERIGADTSRSLPALLADEFPGAYELVTSIMSGERDDPPIPSLHAIINSPIDVDKIAYLQADSRETGIAFGRGIDIDGLAQNLLPPAEHDLDKGVLAIREEGMAAAESVVTARFWMISRVYWHRTNRAIMAMYKHVIASLIRDARFDFLGYFSDTLGKTHEEGGAVLYRLIAPDGESGEIRIPIESSGTARRGLYGRLVTVAGSPGSQHAELHAAMLDANPLDFLEAAEAVRQTLNSRLKVNLRPGDVLVDVPRKGRDKIESGVLVYLDRDPSRGRDLLGEFSVSPMLRSLPQDFEANVKKCRVFVRRDSDDAFEPAARARDAIIEGLNSFYLRPERGSGTAKPAS